MALTARQVETAKPKEKDYKLSDQRGLFLLVTTATEWHNKCPSWSESYAESVLEALEALEALEKDIFPHVGNAL